MVITGNGWIRKTLALVRPAALGLCVILLSLLAVACGGKLSTSTPKTEKSTTPVKQPDLSIVNSWSVDNLTHLEPMQVTDVTAASANTLFVAFVASDSGQGPARGGPPLDGKIENVEGGGLAWTRRAEAHLSITGEPSIAEIWTAFTPAPLQPFTVTVARNNDHGALTSCDNYQGGSGPDIANGMVMVQAITGADPENPIGATAVAGVGQRSGRIEPASVTLTTTRPDSLVEAVGSDWSAPAQRVLPAGQVILHEDVSSPNGDTYWVQGLSGPVATPGPVTLSLTNPTDHACNMAAVEILRAP